jgi:hypothetical protein
LSLRGNRRINHAIHMAAITQISHKHSHSTDPGFRTPQARFDRTAAAIRRAGQVEAEWTD